VETVRASTSSVRSNQRTTPITANRNCGGLPIGESTLQNTRLTALQNTRLTALARIRPTALTNTGQAN